MRTDTPPVVQLKDYRPFPYRVDSVRLEFDLHPTGTRVRATLQISRLSTELEPLRLDGEHLDLLSIAVDGAPLDKSAYQTDADGLTIHEPGEQFELCTETRIAPETNTALSGLYMSGGRFCSQCEAEGFRRITYFPDRPDVLAPYTVRIEATLAFPYLLSNGNPIAAGELPDGRHFAEWDDPHPKPSYLFALVAGTLDAFEDTFTTSSGRAVDLKIWVEPGNAPRCAYAMDALKRSMAWDESRFGLEYDLDIFNIVAVSDFNMGAMENKSLNVFNAKYILADPETATDADFSSIEGIVAHEYFHNWTGNRVACRDWFQLSLKEGLTVFRDQEFTADMRSRPVKRIQDVRMLRARQFPEDSGPLAHPVRPESYIEINNFYTATVYEKGAEVIRMLHALLGEEGFQAGMRLYFQRHDGQAVTCDDFVAAMADANKRDLTYFKPWYSQAGTPEVQAEWQHDAKAQQLTLTLEQTTKPTPGQPEKQALPIPLRMGLMDAKTGRPLHLRVDGKDLGEETVLALNEATLVTVFEDISAPAVPSLNRGFSAPIALKADYTPQDRVVQMANDPDPFARWEAGQQYATKRLLEMVQALRDGQEPVIDKALIEALGKILLDTDLDPAFRAQAIALRHGDQSRLIEREGPERRALFHWPPDAARAQILDYGAKSAAVENRVPHREDRRPARPRDAAEFFKARGRSVSLCEHAGGEERGEMIVRPGQHLAERGAPEIVVGVPRPGHLEHLLGEIETGDPVVPERLEIGPGQSCATTRVEQRPGVRPDVSRDPGEHLERQAVTGGQGVAVVGGGPGGVGSGQLVR